MKLKLKVLVSLTILIVAVLPLAASAQGFSIVPCGTSANPRPCQFTDLIILMVRVINLLLAASAVVAMLYILFSAYNLVTALGNPQKITGGKEGLRNAVVGFAIILLSFVFINFFVQVVFGRRGCQWWAEPARLWTTNQSCLLPER